MNSIQKFLFILFIPTLGVQSATYKEKNRQRKELKKVEQQTTITPKKFMTKMNYDELKEAKNKFLQDGYKDVAVKYLEKMIPLCSDVKELGSVMLEYADLLFDTGDLPKAGTFFEQFVRLYPGSDRVEYANYKAILCSFYKLLDTQRDQSRTKETITLAEQFLNRSSVFKQYAGEVHNILRTCREKLLESEFNIVAFYGHRGSYNAANTRLACIEQEFGDLIPNLKPRLLTIEYDMALQQNNTKLAEEKRIQLAQFPGFNKPTPTTLAAAKPKKVDFVARF